MDNKNHQLTSFEDWDRWIYSDYNLTMEEFTAREDVKVILEDSNSSLLPLGVNPKDNSLVTYDLSHGPLYVLGDEWLNRTMNLYEKFYFIGQRPGYTELVYFDFLGSDLDLFVNKIDSQTGKEISMRELLYFTLTYEQLYYPELDEDDLAEDAIGEQEKTNMWKILNEGSSAGIYSIFYIEPDYIEKGEVPFTVDNAERGYLVASIYDDNLKHPIYQVGQFDLIAPNFVSDSFIFVQNGKAITVKLPEEDGGW